MFAWRGDLERLRRANAPVLVVIPDGLKPREAAAVRQAAELAARLEHMISELEGAAEAGTRGSDPRGMERAGALRRAAAGLRFVEFDPVIAFWRVGKDGVGCQGTA